ncbi:hypothetical protein DFH94DRAFT_769154 [Russula ochroleuca]|uniref:Uncharacterized protein n=1 Tax=Russula ochroleuca TaxID=152965 RepID=A0A9P5MPG7_9AGAM|nr:hypothetical protein DFH94DRAFT_769154 [Russula ochroleuca]
MPPYMKAPMLPPLLSLLPPIVSTPFCLTYRRIHCATSPVISQARPFIFIRSTPVLFLFPPNLLFHPTPPLICPPLAVPPFHNKPSKQLSS